MRKLRRGFTLLELIIVIVILGIVAKFGVELLIRAYDYYIQSLSESRFQAQSEVAVEQIANRLSYRLPGSEIVRQGSDLITAFTPLASTTDDPASDVTIFEWIGIDADGLRGDGTSTNPTWSGFIDVDGTMGLAADLLMTEGSSTARINGVVNSLLPTSGGFYGSFGLFFIQDTNFNVVNGLGWSGAITDQTRTAHPVNSLSDNRLSSDTATGFAGQKIYEFYKLSWTAYALRHDRTTGELRLIYNYRPWDGQTYENGTSIVLMENVDTFRYVSIGDAIKVQVCTRDINLTTGAYSVCKEKTVF